MDYNRFLSKEAQRLQNASLAGLIHRFAGVEGVISLAGGLPPADSFPMTHLTATTRDGLEVELGAEGHQAYLAQQYNFNPQGYDPLLNWLRNLTSQLHGVSVNGTSSTAPTNAPPSRPAEAPAGPVSHAAQEPAIERPVVRDLVLTSGAIHGICAVISCLTDPGDTLVVDEYTYTHALECVFLPRDLVLLPVRGDPGGGGLDPEDLDVQLTAAGEAAAAGRCRRPRLLYTIPTGHNPTGAVMSEQRKRRILEVCEAHDLLVLEDDAYYWLYYPTAAGARRDGGGGGEGEGEGGDRPTGQPPPGLGGLPRSMLSLDDTAGRVIRVDTFSKLLGPGYRLGWLTAPRPLVSKLANWVMATTVGPCSVTQVLVTRMLQAWGVEGFDAHVRRLQALYGSHAAAAHRAASEHLGDLAEWQPAQAGMFMWLRIKGVSDVAAILDDLVAARVVVVPGSLFATRGLKATLALGGGRGQDVRDSPGRDGDDNGACNRAPVSPFLRLSFASSSPEVVAEGFRRLAEVVRRVTVRSSGGSGPQSGGSELPPQ